MLSGETITPNNNSKKSSITIKFNVHMVKVFQSSFPPFLNFGCKYLGSIYTLLRMIKMDHKMQFELYRRIRTIRTHTHTHLGYCMLWPSNLGFNLGQGWIWIKVSRLTCISRFHMGIWWHKFKYGTAYAPTLYRTNHTLGLGIVTSNDLFTVNLFTMK